MYFLGHGSDERSCTRAAGVVRQRQALVVWTEQQHAQHSRAREHLT